MAFELRQWQKEAMEKYRVVNKKTFLVNATPGAGKTSFSLALAEKLISVKQIDTVIIIVPTDHLRTQWSDAAIEKGIFVDPSLSNKNALIPPDFTGYVATYAQVAMNPGIHMRRATEGDKKTLVIFDEIHHAGDGLSWGTGLEMAFSNVTRRLALTGTPFRTGDELIPFVEYERLSDGTLVSKTDYTYGYKEALADNVVRPVSFAAYSGETQWQNNAGKVLSATLGSTDLKGAKEQQAWKTALDPKGKWIAHVLSAADERLTQVRAAGMKNAGAMILASDQDTARAYAKVLEKITGHKPTVILSDDRKASRKITMFSESKNANDRWLVAVRMVSEGVDVPRLSVGVWATSYRTPLFFAQAVGRFVRSKAKGETATIFLPAVKPLLALAANLEEQRSHVIAPPEQSEDEQELIDPMMDEEEKEPGEAGEYLALSADAEFAHVLFNGQAYDFDSLSDKDKDIIGLPGLLAPEQVTQLLHSVRNREDEIRRKLGEPMVKEEEKEVESPFEAKEVRKNINRVVSRIAMSSGVPHAQIHSRTRKAIPGPATAHATLDILKKRLVWLETQ